LKLDHQFNQLVLAQALQISPFHEDMDSEIGLPGKGARKSGASPPIGAPKMAVGNCASATGLPTDVVKHCLIISDKPMVYVRFPLPPSTTISSLAGAVRFRLPQGSRAAQFIASLVLGPTLQSLISANRFAFYGDDFAIAVHNEEEGEALTKALHETFKSHPAGPFRLKRCEIAYAVDGFSFLQYRHRLNPGTGKVRRRPAHRSYERYARRVAEIVRIYPWAVAVKRVARYRYLWMRSFRRWQWNAHSKLLLWLTTVDAVKAGKALKG
jgi:hypothetical protein